MTTMKSGLQEVLSRIVAQVSNMIYADRRGEVGGQRLKGIFALADKDRCQLRAQQNATVGQDPRFIVGHDIVIGGITLQDLLQVLLFVGIDQHTDRKSTRLNS